MARSAKHLVAEQGILSSPNPRPGKSLSCDTVELVKKFYESDEISRPMPGKKDCVTVRAEGKKEVLQMRLLLSNMVEAHKKFKEDNPQLKVGFTKFTELRPKNVVLAGASGTHSVCVCTIHQNVKLMVEGCKIASIPDFRKLFDIDSNTRISYRHLLAKLSCNPALPECLLGECMLCQNTELQGACDHCDSFDMNTETGEECKYCRKVSRLRNNILEIFERLNIDEVTFKAWVSVDRTSLETLTKKLDVFVYYLIESLAALRTHDFIAKQQAAFLTDRKTNLQAGEIVVIGDFAENFSFVIQDAAQGYHWTNHQATLHPFVVYNLGTKIQSGRSSSVQHDDDTTEKPRCLSFVIISDCLKHDTVAVHHFLKLLLQFLTTVLSVSKVYYFSDGAASQYKNKKNFINLAFHMHDFKISAEWHFFATSHGKGPCDGVGGTVKRLAARTSLQRPYHQKIQTPQQLYEWAIDAVPSVEFRFVKTSDIESEALLLRDRFEAAETIVRTQMYHAYVPSSTTRNYLSVKRYSNASNATTVQIAYLREIIPMIEIKGYVVVEYDKKWWLALVLRTIPNTEEVEVRFLEPSGPSPSFTFPKRNDDLVIAQGHILLVVNPTTPTGRTYQLSTTIASEATAKLKMRNV